MGEPEQAEPPAKQADNKKPNVSQMPSMAVDASDEPATDAQDASTRRLQEWEMQSQAVKSSVPDPGMAMAQDFPGDDRGASADQALTSTKSSAHTLTATVLIAGMEVRDVADVVAKLKAHRLLQTIKTFLNQQLPGNGKRKPIQSVEVVAALRSTLLTVPRSAAEQFADKQGELSSSDWKATVKQAADTAEIQVPENVWVLSMSSDGNLIAASQDLVDTQVPAAAGFSVRQVVMLLAGLGSIALCCALLWGFSSFQQRRQNWPLQGKQYQGGGTGQALGESAFAAGSYLQQFGGPIIRRTTAESQKKFETANSPGAQGDSWWLQAPQQSSDVTLQPRGSIQSLGGSRRSTTGDMHLAVLHRCTGTDENVVPAAGAERSSTLQGQTSSLPWGCCSIICCCAFVFLDSRDPSISVWPPLCCKLRSAPHTSSSDLAAKWNLVWVYVSSWVYVL
jgi:hypothetical protein